MKRLLIALLFASPTMARTHDWTLYHPNVPEPKIIELDPPQTNTFCAANLPCTATGAWTFSNFISSGTATFTGPSPGVGVCRFENIRYVDPTNSCGWVGTNVGVWANSAAADIGGAGTIVFSPGTYSIPSTANGHIVVPADNVSYVCAQYRTCFLNGSSWVAGDFFFLIAAAHKATYIGGFVMQCAPAAPSADMRGITTNTGAGITSSFGVFENNEILDCFDGIDLGNGSSDNYIRFNYLHNLNQQGTTVNGNRNHILSNRIDTIGTTNLHHGMYIQDGTANEMSFNHISNIFGFCIVNFSTVTSTSITDSRIIGNYCLNGGLSGSGTRGGIFFAETPPTTGVRQGIVSGNTIENTTGNPIYIGAVTDTVVSDNTVRTYQGDCLIVQAGSGFTTTNVLVRGNVCKNGSVSGNGIRTLPNSGTIANITIEGNQVDTAFGWGIEINACTDCLVINNRVKDYNIQGSNSNSGIQIDGNASRVIVEGNNVSTVNSTGAPAGILVAAGGNDNAIRNNILLNLGAGPGFFDSGTRTQVFGNHTQTTTAVFEMGPAGSTMAGSTSGAVTFSVPAVAGANTVAWNAASGTPALNATGDTVYGTYRVTADQTITAGASLTNIPGLTWTMPANTALNVAFHCEGSYNETTGATSMQFGIQDVTIAPTNIYAKKVAWTSTAVATADNTPTLATTTATGIGAAFTPSAATTVFNFTLDGMIEQPSNASTSIINIMAQFTTNNGVIKRGSYCQVF